MTNERHHINVEYKGAHYDVSWPDDTQACRIFPTPISEDYELPILRAALEYLRTSQETPGDLATIAGCSAITKTIVDIELDRRIAHLKNDPEAFKEQLGHFVEMFNNNVALIHTYREFVNALNVELNRQCNETKKLGFKLGAYIALPINRLLDSYNQMILDTRRSCLGFDPQSLCRTSIMKLTDCRKVARNGK